MKVKDITYVSLLTAILCIMSPLSLAIGPIPLSLANFSVFFVTMVAGRKGAYAVVLYVLLGVVGLPVFSGFTGGFQQIAGITGGFIAGYVLSALLIGFLKCEENRVLFYLKMFLANVIIYFFGVLWFVCLTETEIFTALTICVFPFVIPDIIKTVIAGYLSLEVKKTLEKAIKL